MQDDLLDAIDTFYECADDGFDHQRAISTFSRATDDTGLCLVDIKLNGKFKLLGYKNIPEDSMEMMVHGPWTPQNHGILRNFAKIPVGVPVLHRAVESDQEFYASELYKLAMAPRDLHSIGLCLLKKGLLGGMLNGFIRNPGQKEIDHELLSRMAVLNKHLWRAMQLRRRLETIEEALIQANNVLDLVDFGLVLHGSDGAPIFANASAQRIFETKDGLTLGKGGISITDRETQRQFRDLMDALSQPEVPLAARAGGIVRVPRPSHRKPYSVMVVPMNGSGALGHQNVETVVFVLDPVAKRTTPVKLFASSFDLTPAETQLAYELAEGTSLDAFAAKRGVSRNTVKSHLHSIFAKTETSRQPELVSLLLRSVAGINLKN